MDVIINFCNTFIPVWKSKYYLKKQNIQFNDNSNIEMKTLLLNNENLLQWMFGIHKKSKKISDFSKVYIVLVINNKYDKSQFIMHLFSQGVQRGWL